MVLKCLRGQPRTSFLEKHFAFWLDSERYINVNEFFQVGGMSNIFAAGDITSIKEEKLAERVREAKLSNPYFCATRIQAPRVGMFGRTHVQIY
jgi:NADH dehydrogenase FAD-containing subunit